MILVLIAGEGLLAYPLPLVATDVCRLTSQRAKSQELTQVWTIDHSMLPDRDSQIPGQGQGLGIRGEEHVQLSFRTASVLAVHMGARRIFPVVGSVGVLMTELPPQGPGASPQWGAGGEAPRSWRHFPKIMHKYFIYWVFKQHLQLYYLGCRTLSINL